MLVHVRDELRHFTALAAGTAERAGRRAAGLGTQFDDDGDATMVHEGGSGPAASQRSVRTQRDGDGALHLQGLDRDGGRHAVERHVDDRRDAACGSRAGRCRCSVNASNGFC